MSELQSALAMFNGDLPTCVQRINHPMHQGKPNPKHGKFFFVGTIPAECYDWQAQRSKVYDTEEEALQAAERAGATRIQRADCTFYKGR